MAEINTNTNADAKIHRKRRAKKLSTHIDMTPMVDLMSLLITFFMLTTAFIKPKVMEIVMPKDEGGTIDQPIVPAARTLNLLLSDNNRIYYYIGMPPKNDTEVLTSAGRLQKSDYSGNGLRKILLKRNMLLYEKVDSVSNDFVRGKTGISLDSLSKIIKTYKRKDNKGPIVMIKADSKAKYRNIVDVIDEMQICNVARYAIVDPDKYELKLLANAPL
jgi:biopolymer transport protein ExbD